MNLENSKLVVVPQAAMSKLNWTQNANQLISGHGDPLDMSSVEYYCYNRAVSCRAGKYYVKPAKGKQIEVRKISDNKYEVVL